MNGDKFDLPGLAKQGIYGVCIALIALVAFMFYKNCEQQAQLMKLMENHFTHNTAALEQLRGAVDQSTMVSKELKDYLIRKNGN